MMPRPQLTDIYPTATQLPENLLRFYLYFDQPMARENILDAIHLYDDAGHVVADAFLNNRSNLWSPDGKRLTLLFDPGRVKTGLIAHQTLGRALQAGKSYTLVIDQHATSLSGEPLRQSYRKAFVATPAQTNLTAFEQWHISTPSLGSQDTLMVDLGTAVDHVSLAYQIRLKDSDGKPVAGKIEIGKHESQWRFTPNQPWQQTNYWLEVNPILEDLAGNRINVSFEDPLASQAAPTQPLKRLVVLGESIG